MKKGVCSRLKKFNCEGFFTTIVHHKIRAEEKLTQIKQEPSTPPHLNAECHMKKLHASDQNWFEI